MSRREISDAELRELARSLPWADASGESALVTERAIREAVARRRRPRWPVAIVAAVACGLAVAPLLPERGPRVEILETRGATFRSAIEAELAVYLDEGWLRLDVEGLRGGRTFVVHVGPDRVVVRGTRFYVHARDGRLAGVLVERGAVEVHAPGAPVETLRAGGAWSAPVKTPPGAAVEAEAESTDAAPAPAAAPGSAVRPPVRRRTAAVGSADPRARGELRSGEPTATVPVDEPPSPIPAPLPPGPAADGGEASFVAGWDALRRGEASAAAELLEAVPASAPLAEDARYLRILALVRSGSAEGRPAMEAFLAAFPGSPRAGAVSLLLGEHHVLAHDREAAVPHLRAAAGDRDAEVRARARALLLKIDGAAPDP